MSNSPVPFLVLHRELWVRAQNRVHPCALSILMTYEPKKSIAPGLLAGTRMLAEACPAAEEGSTPVCLFVGEQHL